MTELETNLKILLQKTYPDIQLKIEYEFPFPNKEYGKLNIKCSHVNDSAKLKKEIYNYLLYLCESTTSTNLGFWFRFDGIYYQYDVIIEDDNEGWRLYNSIEVSNSDETGYHREVVSKYTKEIEGKYFYKTVVTPLVLREYMPIDGKGSSIFEWVEKE